MIIFCSLLPLLWCPTALLNGGFRAECDVYDHLIGRFLYQNNKNQKQHNDQWPVVEVVGAQTGRCVVGWTRIAEKVRGEIAKVSRMETLYGLSTHSLICFSSSVPHVPTNQEAINNATATANAVAAIFARI
ncbi:hypothetical protein GPALN_009730 [Globodera pallida]|nr:hypothetical protein GPALN_009730 [Globodera pallida]